MKKLNLLVLLFAMLLTACSDSETEDPNGGGDKTNIVGLNIKDAKLIYGVEKASTRSMLKSFGPSHYYRQVTKENKNLPVSWVKENGDTTSVIAIKAIANLNDDYVIINTHNTLDDPLLMYVEALSYIINKNTGLILNPDSPIKGIDLINTNDYSSFYDNDRYCYVKKPIGGLLKIDLQSYSVTTIFEDARDVNILPSGAFFAYMKDGKHKYGSFRAHTIEEFSDMSDRYLGWDNYIPVDGVVDGLLTIVCNKKNSDGTTTYTTISYSSSNMWDYGFGDRFDQPNTYLTTDFELPPNFPLGIDYVALSIKTSRTSQIIYIGSSDGNHGIVFNNDGGILTRLSDDLIAGLVSGKRIFNRDLDIYPNIATNSLAAFNLKKDYSGDLVITEFNTMTQKTVKDAKGYGISAIVQEKISDAKPVTFLGQNWQENKQCIGTIDEKGNVEILQEFVYGDNESMNGFLMKLN